MHTIQRITDMLQQEHDGYTINYSVLHDLASHALPENPDLKHTLVSVINRCRRILK
jgi:hypothetical protein